MSIAMHVAIVSEPTRQIGLWQRSWLIAAINPEICRHFLLDTLQTPARLHANFEINRNNW
jgi:hypothetical protein